MKSIFPFCAVLLCLSCNISNNTIDPKIDAKMTCLIDAANWEATSIKGIDSGGTISISASDNNGKSIVLALESDQVKVGATLDASYINSNLLDDTRYTITKSGQSNDWTATAGTITITAVSKKAISGKFSFIGTDILGKNKDVKITNGVFTTQIF